MDDPAKVIRDAWERRGSWPEGADVYWVPARPPMSFVPWPQDLIHDRLVPKEELAVEFRHETLFDHLQQARLDRVTGSWGGAHVIVAEHISPTPR